MNALRNAPTRIAAAGARTGPSLLGFARRNRLFTLALAAGAALRALAMIGYPGVTWFYGDSYLYLGAALRPRPNLSKTVGYSFMLRLLEPFGSFTVVAAVQHLMGLAIAVMIYLLLRRANLPAWGAALATLPVLVDGYQIELEHLLMSETLFTFLMVVAVTLVLWRKRLSPWAALVAGLLVGYAVIVRTAGLPMIAILLAYLLVRRVGWRPVLTAAVGCVLPIAAYAGWFHSWNGQYALTRSDGFYLWGRVSSFAECSQIKPPAPEQRLCLSSSPRDRAAPGQLIWKNVPPHHLPGGPVTPANNKLMRDFAIHAVTAQPVAYLHAVVNGVTLAVDYHRIPYPSAFTTNHYTFPYHPTVLPDHRAWIPGGTAAHDAHTYGHATASRLVKPFSSAMRLYERYVYTPGPVFGLMLLLGVVGVFRFWRRIGGPVLLPCASALVLLVFPIAVADFDYRYLVPVMPFACLAAALAFVRPPAASADEPASDVPVGEVAGAAR